ncbi:MAG: hypothetical protein ACPG4Y_02610 [Chitinophagales bacterium]
MDNLNLIDFFSIEQLETVKEDILTTYEGTNILYVIDTYDIVNYSLPFVNSDKLQNDNKFAFSTIFYENVFNLFEDIDLILADEYKTELVYIVDNLSSKIKDFPSIRRKLIKEIKAELNNNEEGKDSLKTLFENFELIIVLYIFIEKGENLFEKFNNFVHKFSIETFESKNIDSFNCEEITNTFSKTIPSDNTNKIFDSFVEENKYKIASLPNDYERYCFLDNSYRDISVIDRVINVNTAIKGNFKVHYLSSTPNKTKVIFDLTNSKNGYFHRNISQLFLLKNITAISKDCNEAIDSIQSLIELKKFETSIYKNENKTLNILNSLTESLKKEVTTNYFHSSFRYYIELFDNLNSEEESLKKESLSKILNLLDKINIEIPDYILTDKLRSKLTLGQLQTLSINLESNNIQINLGDDIIKNTFHHLPYILFNEIKPNDTIKEFHSFMNKLSNSSFLIGNSTKMFSSEIKTLLQNLSVKKFTFKGQSIDSVILIYLNLIAETNENIIDENDIIKLITNKLSLIDNSKLRLSLKNKELSINKNEINEFSDDLNYLLLWLYRRVNSFDKCIELFNSNPIYSKSCRFNHGIGLCHHSKAYDLIKKSKKKALDNLKKSKKYLLEAYFLYSESINETDYNFNQLIKKQQVAILNTIIDANLRMFDINNEIDVILLKESREVLNHLKKIIEIDLSQIEYDSLETINHTESELEYYEALNEYNHNNFLESVIKLNYTTDRLKIVMQSKILIENRFLNIESKVNKLRYDNFKKLDVL